MNLATFKEIVKEYPTVWKTTKPWLFKDSEDIYKVGVKFRLKLENEGFRQVDDEEDMKTVLAEAEEFLSKNDA